MIILRHCREYRVLYSPNYCCLSSALWSEWRFLFILFSTSGGPCERLHRKWGTAPTLTRLMWSRAAPEHGSTATSVGWLKPVRPSLTRQTSTSSRSCINALSVSTGWGIWETALRCCSIMLQFHILLFGYSLFFGFCHCAVPPGAWWVLHQRSGPLPDPSCFVWPCLSSHHTTVCTENASVGPFFLFIFFSPFPLFYLSSCLFNIPRSVLLTPSFPSLLFFLSGAQWC